MFGLTYFEEIIAYFWQLLQRAFEKLVIIFFKKSNSKQTQVNREKHKITIIKYPYWCSTQVLRKLLKNNNNNNIYHFTSIAQNKSNSTRYEHHIPQLQYMKRGTYLEKLIIAKSIISPVHPNITKVPRSLLPWSNRCFPSKCIS